jgi:hypothetical protein
MLHPGAMHLSALQSVTFQTPASIQSSSQATSPFQMCYGTLRPTICRHREYAGFVEREYWKAKVNEGDFDTWRKQQLERIGQRYLDRLN